MSAQHTPGPWEIDGQYVQQAGQTVVAVCEVLNMDQGGTEGWYSGSITQANALLIAAAPDLLAVAEAALWEDDGLSCADALRAAIAKAKGEQP